MKIVSSRLMAEIDQQSQNRFSLPGLLLMENAGARAFEKFLQVQRESGSPSYDGRDLEILCLAGGGNNGGDALVIARHAFNWGYEKTKVLLRNRRNNEQVRKQLEMLQSLGVPVYVWEEEGKEARQRIAEAQVIFDGVAGTGLKGELRGTAADLVHEVEQNARAYIVAVDGPSGLGDEFRPSFPALKADLSITMGLPKYALYTPAGRLYAGRIEVVSPGFPRALTENPKDSGELLTWENDYLEAYRIESVKPGSYKGDRGHLAVFAGRVGTSGAAMLCGESAARCGLGLVTLFCDQDIYPRVGGTVDALMVRPLSAQEFQLPKGVTKLLVGPGWGVEGRKKTLLELLNIGLPGVIDAEGLSVLSLLIRDLGTSEIRKKTARRWVLTPHPGEFLRLYKALGEDVDKERLLADPLPLLRRLAEELQAIVLLKTHVLWLCDPEGEYKVVDGMNPAMGTGGSGDVLAGVIAGLLGRGESFFHDAAAGVLIHQRIGRIAAGERGWFIADEMLSYISQLTGGLGA